jgi:hypothetical protein
MDNMDIDDMDMDMDMIYNIIKLISMMEILINDIHITMILMIWINV